MKIGINLNDGPFVIMRFPVLMEDEGRYECIKVCTTREEAKNWIEKQKDEYFKPSDYFIQEPTRQEEN